MPIKVQLVFEDDTGGPPIVKDVAQIERDAHDLEGYEQIKIIG